MNRIIPQLEVGSVGRHVRDLHDALLFLAERDVINALDAPNHPTPPELRSLLEGVRGDQSTHTFGTATQFLVRSFQIQQGLGDLLRGTVDVQTAARLNEMLEAFGAFGEPDVSPRANPRERPGTPSNDPQGGGEPAFPRAMHPINPPLSLGSKGPAVGNLLDG